MADEKFEFDMHGGLPAVCIKVYEGLDSVKYPIHLGRFKVDGEGDFQDHFTDEGFDATWIYENLSIDAIEELWFIAAEDQVNLCVEESKDLFRDFGYDVEIAQAGRSGGWLEVQGLPDVWDCTLQDAWKRFCKWCQHMVDHFPQVMAECIYVNVWEARKEKEEERKKEIEKIWEEVETFFTMHLDSCYVDRDMQALKKQCPKLVAKVEDDDHDK